MKEFSKRIRVDGSFIAEFVFHMLYRASGNHRFYISVQDKSGRHLFFNMDQVDDGLWKIVDAPKVPDWIMQMQKELQNAILERTEHSF